MALGAQRASVARLVLGESLKVTAAALLVGVPLSLAAGRLLRTFLFGITSWDIPTLVGASVILSAVSMIAAVVPAHRASRVDPMLALKYE
jgi:putative ABC transport system permease protein